MSNSLALVLMYHHIADVCADPGVLSVSPDHFAEHLEVLRQETQPLSLNVLTERLSTGGVPSRSVVITFDDGYQDNLVNAKPLLERHDIPATVFVTAGRAGHRTPFWWDELERLLLYPGTLAAHLDLRIGDQPFRYDLGEAAVYGEDAVLRLRKWRAWEDPPTPRHALYTALREILVAMRDDEQQAVIKALEQWANVPESNVRAHRRLSDGEIVSLSANSSIDVGGHTVTHPMLSALTPDRQVSEVQGNKSHLEEILGTPISSFAYPYGAYSLETLGIVRDAGFAGACSTIVGPVQPNSDPFRLPRHHVYDWDGDEFAQWLRRAWMTT